MESQQQDKDENLFARDNDTDFSSGPLADGDGDIEEMDDDEEAADDELDEAL